MGTLDRRLYLRLSVLLNVALLVYLSGTILPGDSWRSAGPTPSVSGEEGVHALSRNGHDVPLSGLGHRQRADTVDVLGLGAQEDFDLDPVPPQPAMDQCGICASDVGQQLCGEWGESAIARGISYAGSNNRLRRVLANMRDGKPFSVGVIGGSVSAGHGMHTGAGDEVHIMHRVLFDHLDAKFPSAEPAATGPGRRKDGVRNVFYNGAEPARGSDYFSMCLGHHLNDDVDLVIVELAINDPPQVHTANLFENLIRTILEMPSQPAVLIVNTFALMFESIGLGGDLNLGRAQYYDVPVLSTRNAVLPFALSNHTLLADWFGHQNGKVPVDPETLENVDLRHFGKPLHVFSGRLMSAYIDSNLCEMDRLEASAPSTPPHELYPLDPLPSVRLQDKYKPDGSFPKLKPFCITTNSDQYPLEPVKQSGWRKWAWKDKKYLVADTPGASITFEFETTLGNVLLYYLRSWEFPLGNLKCWVDDDVGDAKISEGRWDLKMNIGRTTLWSGLAPGKHELHCEVLEETSDPSGGHEFRLMSLMSL